ncbi:MAG: phosphatidylglycerol lysyltransferase domain-containing protein [Firmicutes bacterium]|nr:phosphatidylglycerol lysyltransferase domain-containing protein [Bacillota bacterium]
MKYRPITLADKSLFDQFLDAGNHSLITYNFANLYLWRHWDRFTWQIQNDALCIKSEYNGRSMTLPPICQDRENLLATTEDLIRQYRENSLPFIMTEVSQDMWEFFEQAWPGRFRAEEHRSGANYIYRREDLANLKGKHYDSKRNHIHRFEKEYPDYQFVPLCRDLVDPCKQRQKAWRYSHNPDNEQLILEEQGIMDALDHYQELGLSGACLLVNGQLEGFTLGNRLDGQTWAVHIEKGNMQIHGSYQIINRLYARDYCQDAVFINRAEDMGDPGLRKSKLSYHPCRLENKYLLTLK